MSAQREIVIVGGGYVGFHTARRLERQLRPGEASVTLIDLENFHLFRPLLPEVASGTIEPRHAVVPLRDALRRTTVISGRLAAIDHQARSARVVARAGETRDLPYDELVVAVGSMTKVLPVPGLADQALGFASIAEAVGLRNRVLDRLEAAAGSTDASERAQMLTFCFVGGGYTGVEAVGELHDMACEVCDGYDELSRHELRFVLLEATDRLLPTVDEALAAKAERLLRRRGVDVRLETQLKEVQGETLSLSDGSTLHADTLVWVAGVTPQRVVGDLDLPLDDDHRIVVDECLRVRERPHVWSAGDCAAVPDTVAGGFCPPTAQYAEREGRRLGDNLVAAVRGLPPEVFRYRSRGEFVTLGMRKGVAEVFGREVTGFSAWALRRSYYASRIPTGNRKLRLALDWAVRLPFGHDVVDLSATQEPREPLQHAAGS